MTGAQHKSWSVHTSSPGTQEPFSAPTGNLGAYHDPYDIWALPFPGRMKVAATRGSYPGLAVAAGAALVDLLCPTLLRRLKGITPRRYTHVDALCYMAGLGPSTAAEFTERAHETAITAGAGIGWGYPFDWYSRNAPGGVYAAGTVPFVTITPYVMEALLTVRSRDRSCAERAQRLFDRTWGFLESLRPMIARDDVLALSYAPVDEPLPIVNANSYAAYAYALHASHGRPLRRVEARRNSIRLARWVVDQQQADGAWWYLAAVERNNFIDCFHSCMTVKNLVKTRALLGDSLGFVGPAIDRGWDFIRTRLYDPKAGLCRRFLHKGTKDPLYRWDLYDQAEYLGLLVDFGLVAEAIEFRSRVTGVFASGSDWYSRVTVFGSRWGKNHLRWGIAPFWYHSARLQGVLGTNEDR